MKKMTKKECFTLLLAMAEVRENVEIVEILEKEIANLEKRAAAPRKPSKTQVENGNLAVQLADFLEPDRVYTTGEIVELYNAANGTEYSVQKLSRVLPLVPGIKKIEEKRKISWMIEK